MKQSNQFGAFLLLTVAVTGALVMVVEIAGARVIAPFFGVGLFVWTALISVTLLSLAGGYWLGGILVDRRASAAMLYLLIGAAGLFLLMTPWLRGPVLLIGVSLGLRAGAFVSAGLLFAVPLFLLGMVSPFAVRLGAKVWENLGRTVGAFYAVSTAGSFIGSVATGFYILELAGVGKTIALSGVILLILSALYFLLFGKRPGVALAAFASTSIALLMPASPVEARMPDGTQVRIIEQRDSFYGNLKVIEYRSGERGIRELTIDGLIQGGVDLNTGEPVYEYLALLLHLPRLLRPDTNSALIIGLGTGVLPRAYAGQAMRTEVVDIDPAVIDLCRRHFGLPQTVPVHQDDARSFLSRSDDHFGLIVLDVFSGDTTPGHLLSIEALHSVRARLTPGGLVAFNLIGSLDAEDAALPMIIATIRGVFDHVILYPLIDQTTGNGNVIVVASNLALASPMANTFPVLSPMVSSGVFNALQEARPIIDDFRGHGILTDDFNPIDILGQQSRDAIRRDILENTPLELLGS